MARRQKTIHQMYVLLWSQIKDKETIAGLCIEINILYESGKIDFYERTLLKQHLEFNMPRVGKHVEFTKSDTWLGNTHQYWWSIHEEFNPVNRKAFIEKMIKITKP